MYGVGHSLWSAVGCQRNWLYEIWKQCVPSLRIDKYFEKRLELRKKRRYYRTFTNRLKISSSTINYPRYTGYSIFMQRSVNFFLFFSGNRYSTYGKMTRKRFATRVSFISHCREDRELAKRCSIDFHLVCRQVRATSRGRKGPDWNTIRSVFRAWKPFGHEVTSDNARCPRSALVRKTRRSRFRREASSFLETEATLVVVAGSSLVVAFLLFSLFFPSSIRESKADFWYVCCELRRYSRRLSRIYEDGHPQRRSGTLPYHRIACPGSSEIQRPTMPSITSCPAPRNRSKQSLSSKQEIYATVKIMGNQLCRFSRSVNLAQFRERRTKLHASSQILNEFGTLWKKFLVSNFISRLKNQQIG